MHAALILRMPTFFRARCAHGLPHVLDHCGIRGVPLHPRGRRGSTGDKLGDVLVQEGADPLAIGEGVPLGVQRLREPKHLPQSRKVQSDKIKT